MNSAGKLTDIRLGVKIVNDSEKFTCGSVPHSCAGEEHEEKVATYSLVDVAKD
jgi:hypothetical protein